MRYTKTLQAAVISDTNAGISPQECSKKYNLPISVVLKWSNIKTSEQRAKEIAVRKYQVEVSDAEAEVVNKITQYLSPDLSDNEYLTACEKISKELYNLVSNVVKKERDLNPHEDPKDNLEIIQEIVDKWLQNKELEKYSHIISDK